MALIPGARLGPYEIVAALGAGGMGQVYRAHDTKLNRDVALKILPDAFASDSDRLARFTREAQTLASLNHPNIAHIHGLEESGGVRALVMELVEGDDLSQRIARGAIPLDEALPIAKQIAEALEAAHEQGIIHRDLKPANIKVRPDGTVKVLDFGLAKAMEPVGSVLNVSQSPTITTPAMTQAGVILGTAAYMSPEQAKGRAADKRSDVWAFGCVLYEMLTGARAFEGEDVSDTLAAVLRGEPNWMALPAGTPPPVRLLLRRCLEKDRKRRLDSAADARLEIEEAASGSSETARTALPAHTGRREAVAWGLAGLATAAAVGLAVWHVSARSDTRVVRFFVSPPETGRLAMAAPTASGAFVGPAALSPDGQRIAIVATSADGKSRLWVRSLDTLTARALPGTDGAFQPFWSPDNRFLGFFAGGKLKKIEVSGGPPIPLCDAPDPRSGTWNRDGVIVFGPTATSALQRVSASGGVPTAATTLGQGESTHMRPFFLPDGRHFLYRASTAGGAGPIYVGSLDSTERTLLLNADSSNVGYAQGHLLFLRETTLMAQQFDARRLVLTGDAVPIAEDIRISSTTNPSGVFSASENGVLAYQTGTTAAGSQLVWFDRTGKQISVLGDPALYGDLALAPDGQRVSVSLPSVGKGRDIWLYDVARGLKTRFTFDSADNGGAIWSPDGNRLAFSSRRKGHLDLYQKASSGAGAEEVLLEDNHDKFPMSWSPDGRHLLYRTAAIGGAVTGIHLFVLPFADRKPTPFLAAPLDEANGQFSPDGRWVVYRSDDSGRRDVYVAPFPGPGGKWQVSTAGGDFPRWRSDGSEIFYLAPDNQLMAATVSGKNEKFEVGAVRPLFETRQATGFRYAYDVAAAGQRFLINTSPEQPTSEPITVVLNWTAGLKP